MNKKFLKELLKYLPGKIVPAIIGFISIPIITKLFPPDSYGNYTLALSVVNFLAITVGWIGMANIRFYPSYEKEGKIFEYSSVVFKIAIYSILISATAFAVGLFFFKKNINPELYRLLWVSIPFFMVFTFFTVSQNFLRVNDRVGLFSVSGIWRVTTSFLIGIALVFWLNFSIEGLLWGSTISIILAMIYLFNKSFGKINFKTKIDKSILKQFFIYSYPLVLSSGFAYLTKFSDRFFLMHFRDANEVGLYAASYKVADFSIMLITTLFLYASHPMSIKVWEQNGPESSKKFLSSTTGLYIALALPAVVGLSMLYNEISIVLLDEEYWAGGKVLPLIAAAMFFYGLQQRYQSGIHFFKKTVYITYSLILASIVSIVFNIILIPRFGYTGAAFSALLAYFSMAVYMIIFSRKLIKWSFPFKIFFKSLGASFLMALTLFIIPFQLLTMNLYIDLFSKIAIGAVVYILFLVLFKTFNFKEIKSKFRKEQVN